MSECTYPAFIGGRLLELTAAQVAELTWRRLSNEQRHGALLARVLALEAAQAVIIKALRQALSVLEHANIESGYCMCGSPVAEHGLVDGHSPVDHDAYHAGLAADFARQVLAAAGELP